MIFFHGIYGRQSPLRQHVIHTADAVGYIVHDGAVEIPENGFVSHTKAPLQMKISINGKK
jgi:hypothetical protein